MTIEEFIQTLLLAVCLAICCLVLPTGLVVVSAAQTGQQLNTGLEVQMIFVDK